jgi:phage protein D
MSTPIYQLNIGGVTIDSAANPGTSTVVEIAVALDLDTPADQAVIRLGRAGGVVPSVGADVTVDLGYAETTTERVFTGVIDEVRPDVTGVRVSALGALRKLLALRIDQTYREKTAGAIVRDLASRAALPLASVEDGVSYLVYVADEHRSAYHHARALADANGFLLYADSEGKLVFRDFSGQITTHLFEYGEQLLWTESRLTPAGSAQVRVIGESPADSAGTAAFAWVSKGFNAGIAGSGTPTLVIEDAALRTHEAAARAAGAALQRLSQRQTNGRLRALGRPAARLGDAIRVRGEPDENLNGTFQVRAVSHLLSKQRGFTTDIRFWGLGSEAG